MVRGEAAKAYYQPRQQAGVAPLSSVLLTGLQSREQLGDGLCTAHLVMGRTRLLCCSLAVGHRPLTVSCHTLSMGRLTARQVAPAE